MSDNYKNQAGNVRVIDSNERIRERLKDLIKDNKLKVSGASPDGFVEGLFDDAERIEEPQIDLEAIKAEADAIMANANDRAAQIIASANEEAAIIAENARASGEQEGFNAGMEQANAVLAEKEQELSAKEQAMQEKYDRDYAEMESELLKTLMQVVEDVFHVEFAHSPAAVLASINGVVSDVDGTKLFNIKTNKMNYAFLSPRKDQIESLVAANCEIEFSIDDSLSDSQCLIETDMGIYDCSLDVQLGALFEKLKSLC